MDTEVNKDSIADNINKDIINDKVNKGNITYDVAQVAKNYLHSSDLDDIGENKYDLSKVTVGEFLPTIQDLLRDSENDALGNLIRYQTLKGLVKDFMGYGAILNKDQLEVYKLYQEELVDFSKKMLVSNLVSSIQEMIYCNDFRSYDAKEQEISVLNGVDHQEEIKDKEEELKQERNSRIEDYTGCINTDRSGYKPSAKSVNSLYDMCEELYQIGKPSDDNDPPSLTKGKTIILNLLSKWATNPLGKTNQEKNISDMPLKDVFAIFESIYYLDYFPNKRGGNLCSAMTRHSKAFLLGQQNVERFLENSIALEMKKTNPFETGLLFSPPGSVTYQGRDLGNIRGETTNYELPNAHVVFKIQEKEGLSSFVHYDYNKLNEVWKNPQALFEKLKESNAIVKQLDYSSFEVNLKVSKNNISNIKAIFGNFQEENPEFIELVKKFHKIGNSLDIGVGLNGVRDNNGHLVYINRDYNYPHELANNILNQAPPTIDDEIEDYPKLTPEFTGVKYYALDTVPEQNGLGNKADGLLALKNSNYPMPEALVFPIANSHLYQQKKSAWLKSLRPELNKISNTFKDRNGRPALCSVSQSKNNGEPELSILNIGIDDTNYDYLSKEMGQKVVNECVINFMTSFCQVSFTEVPQFSTNLPKALFQFRSVLNRHGVSQDFDSKFPLNSRQQQRLSLDNILKSGEDMGIVVQKMVYGNKNELSGFGEFTSRDTKVGERGIQGIFTPCSQSKNYNTYTSINELKNTMPNVYSQLEKAALDLEIKEKCIQKIEFVVENGEVYFTNKRNVEMKPLAQSNLNLDLYSSGLIDKRQLLNSFSVEAFYGSDRQSEKEELLAKVLTHFGVVGNVPPDIFKPIQDSLQPKKNWLKDFSHVNKVEEEMTFGGMPTLGGIPNGMSVERKVVMMLIEEHKTYQNSEEKALQSNINLNNAKARIAEMNSSFGILMPNRFKKYGLN